MASNDPDGSGGDGPVGKLRIKITSLEMRDGPPRALPLRLPPPATRIERVGNPTVPFYRFLYETVGAPWLWYERRRWPDARIAETLQHPDVELHVLYRNGQPAGFAELDRRTKGQVELAYFGLLPQFIGARLGPYLLEHAVRKAWASRPERLWVHTCTLDHPAALRTYENVGFKRYDEVWRLIDDPRLLGLIPPDTPRGLPDRGVRG